MSYHADFWIAAATAGPVLALTHAVTAERWQSRIIESSRQLLARRRKAEAAARYSRPKGGPARRDRAPQPVADNDWLLLALAMVALIAFSLALLATISALMSLASESDISPIPLAEWQLVASFCLLIVQQFIPVAHAAIAAFRDVRRAHAGRE